MRIFVLTLTLLIGGCGGPFQTIAVISDLDEDKVIVTAEGGDMRIIDAEAMRGCAIHDRVAERISSRCLDAYCYTKDYLYACHAK